MSLCLLKNLKFLVFLLLLGSCGMTIKDVSDKTSGLLKKEDALFNWLSKSSDQFGAQPSATPYENLQSNGSQLREYLNLLAVLDNTLFTTRANTAESIKKEVARMKAAEIKDREKLIADGKPAPDLMDWDGLWKNEHRPLIEKFIVKQKTLILALTPWDFDDLKKLTRDVGVVKFEGDKISLVLPQNTVAYKAKDIEKLLKIFYGDDKVPPVTLDISIQVLRSEEYKDTRSDCLKIVKDYLWDPDCAADAGNACGHQMNLECVWKRSATLKDKHCRTRETKSYFSGGELLTSTKFVANTDSRDVVAAVEACNSSRPILAK